MTHDKFAAEDIVKSEIFDILTGYASGKAPAPPVIVDLSCEILKILVTEKFVEETDDVNMPRRAFQSTDYAVDEEIDGDSD